MTLATAGNLAYTLAELGELQAARELAEETAARHRQVYGDDHRETMWSISVLIGVLKAAGDDARALAENSLARHRRLFGDDHPMTLGAAHDLREIIASKTASPANEQP